jgi:hypothetical protein
VSRFALQRLLNNRSGNYLRESGRRQATGVIAPRASRDSRRERTYFIGGALCAPCAPAVWIVHFDLEQTFCEVPLLSAV